MPKPKRSALPSGSPVSEDELKDAILQMMIERFGDRQLDWETVQRALKIVNFEIKQLAVFAPRA